MKPTGKDNESLRLLQKQIGERLSELRMQKGYSTQADFAAAHDLPPIQYWRMENGKANITLRSLHRIAAIHGIPVSKLFIAPGEKGVQSKASLVAK